MAPCHSPGTLDRKEPATYGNHISSTKTTVYLAEEDYRQIKLLARERKRSAAELVREAVAEYARRRSRKVRPRSLGAGRSGRGDLSERAEELLKGLGRSR